MTLAARRATPAELALVQQITKAAYSEYTAILDDVPLPIDEDYAPGIAGGEVWLVSKSGRDMGLVVLRPAPDHLLIFSLAVLPDAQGAGVGRWMLRFAEEQARSAGLPEMRLYTNALMARNIRVYGEAGFREVGRRPNLRRPGWVFVDMMKSV